MLQHINVSEGLQMPSEISDDVIHTIRKNIGLLIRSTRLAKGITQKTLAAYANVNQGDLSQIENGTAPLGRQRAERIAQALNLDVNRILLAKQLPQPAACNPPVTTRAADTQPADGAPLSAGIPKNNTPGNALPK